MAVPSGADAARMLMELEPPAWLLRHSAGVADVAAFLALQVEQAGHAVDRRLVESAALLHDLDKALPAGDLLLDLGHGYAGAAWLTANGHAELAAAVANHPVLRLAQEDHYQAWSRDASFEERLVAYADKRVAQRVVPMSQRFDEWRRRFPRDQAAREKSWQRARKLEDEVCALAGIRPDQVRRQYWATRALAAGRQAAA